MPNSPLQEVELNAEFFELLYQHSEFCEAIGKVTLAASRFESDLREYLRRRGVTAKKNLTLGPLIASLERHGMLSENGVQVLRGLKQQRNYLTHSLYDLFANRTDETLLPRDNLVPEDVFTFVDKAWELEQNLVGLTGLLEDAVARIQNGPSSSEHDDELLFRP